MNCTSHMCFLINVFLLILLHSYGQRINWWFSVGIHRQQGIAGTQSPRVFFLGVKRCLTLLTSQHFLFSLPVITTSEMEKQGGRYICTKASQLLSSHRSLVLESQETSSCAAMRKGDHHLHS